MMGSSCVRLWIVGHFALGSIENPQGVYWQMLPTGCCNREFSSLPAPQFLQGQSAPHLGSLLQKKYIFFSTLRNVPSTGAMDQACSRPKALSPPARSCVLPFPLHLFLWSWLCVRSSIRVLRYPGERRNSCGYFSLLYTSLRNKWDP